jgi:hypothetical protein
MSKLTFLDCLWVAVSNAELVANYNRLTGEHLGEQPKRSPIELLVDQATGYEETVQDVEVERMRKFASFVKDIVWDRLPQDIRDTSCWVPA